MKADEMTMKDTMNLSAVREDMQALREDFKALKDDVVAAGTGAAKQVTQGAVTQFHNAADKYKKAQDQTLAFVQERPITSLLIAIGVGAIVAKLLARR